MKPALQYGFSTTRLAKVKEFNDIKSLVPLNSFDCSRNIFINNSVSENLVMLWIYKHTHPFQPAILMLAIYPGQD